MSRLFTRERAPYALTILIILLDFTAVFFVTLWDVDFDISILKTANFWLNYVVKTSFALIAYYALTYLGSVSADKTPVVDTLRKSINDARNTITVNLLDDEQEKYLAIKNRVSKCIAYLNKLDGQLRRAKDDLKRNKIREEKKIVAAVLCLEREKIDKSATLTVEKKAEYEKILENSDFDIDALRNVKYLRIEKRALDGSGIYNQGKVIGVFARGKILAADSAFKLVPSLLGVMVISIMMQSAMTMNIAQIRQTILLIMLILANCLTGWNEGNNLILIHKKAVLEDIKDVQSGFFNYCYSFGLLDKNKN